MRHSLAPSVLGTGLLMCTTNAQPLSQRLVTDFIGIQDERSWIKASVIPTGSRLHVRLCAFLVVDPNTAHALLDHSFGTGELWSGRQNGIGQASTAVFTVW